MRSLTCSKSWQKTSILINQISIIPMICILTNVKTASTPTTTASLLGVFRRAAHHCEDPPAVHRGPGHPLGLCHVRLYRHLYGAGHAVCCPSTHHDARNSGTILRVRGDFLHSCCFLDIIDYDAVRKEACTAGSLVLYCIYFI